MKTIHSIKSLSTRPLFGFLLVTFACFGVLSIAEAKPKPTPTPPPDGDIGNGNTAGGNSALFSVTTGTDNTGLGSQALFSNTSGSLNTATGSTALVSNTTGDSNTANGYSTLRSNTTGGSNTAAGDEALSDNTTGFGNTAYGSLALRSNTTASGNVAMGFGALGGNTSGFNNTACGSSAMQSNTTGTNDDAYGDETLLNNTTGTQNTAMGGGALHDNTTGSNNIALGNGAGYILTTGDNNIEIGNAGQTTTEANTIRIGLQGTQSSTFIAGIAGATVAGGSPVVVDGNGQLGTTPSSRRFKEEIKPMEKSSESIFSLRPVTFRYKQKLDPKGIPQFGLVAEEVEKVNPELVVRDAGGTLYSVRYDAVNAMLLNEFLKEHRKVQELEATVARQQKGLEALSASVKEQASQIQKVSDQLRMTRPAPQMAANDH